MTESLGISITSQCQYCLAGLNLTTVLDTLEVMCADCLLDKESNSTTNAYNIVDEGNLQYQQVWSDDTAQPSGHDWVASVVKMSDRTKRFKVGASMTENTIREYLIIEEMIDTRDEFLEPVTNLADRFMDLETSVTTLDYEVTCKSCNLLYHKSQDNCPICY